MGIESLQGLIMKRINGMEINSELIEFVTDDDRRFIMWHEQACCEHVCLEDVVGHASDLIGHPILIAEVRATPDQETDSGDEKWTFYTIATVKGTVDLRWYGTSNGYYSIDVSFGEDCSTGSTN